MHAVGSEACRPKDGFADRVGYTGDCSYPRVAVLPFVEHIQLEGDAAVDHQPWTAPETGRRYQADSVGPPFVDMDDVRRVQSKVTAQRRGGSWIQNASERQAQEGKTGVGT